MLRASNIAAAPSAATERTNGPSGWQVVAARMATVGAFGTTAGANSRAGLKPE